MIILTGYNGFIGNKFKEKLKDENLILVEKKDIFKFKKEFTQWNKVSLILHQGAISSTTEQNIIKLTKYNVNFSIWLLKKAIKYKIPIKYASSASVYGNSKINAISPLNFYAISKLQIDYFVLNNINKFNTIQGFRYFNVYGNTEHNKGNQASPIFKFRNQIKQRGIISLFKNSNQYFRDFICVDDVVNIVLENNINNGIYDLGTSQPISFLEVAKIIVDKEGGKIEEIDMPNNLKNHYQTYTRANMNWISYNFKTVKEYVKEST